MQEDRTFPNTFDYNFFFLNVLCKATGLDKIEEMSFKMIYKSLKLS